VSTHKSECSNNATKKDFSLLESSSRSFEIQRPTSLAMLRLIRGVLGETGLYSMLRCGNLSY
jgi:hypothetical protein